MIGMRLSNQDYIRRNHNISRNCYAQQYRRILVYAIKIGTSNLTLKLSLTNSLDERFGGIRYLKTEDI